MMGLWLVLQFIISAHAGLVNYVDGQTSVRVHDQIAAGVPIQTTSGRVEILLNPGSFLRLDENSSAVLDSVDLTNISIRITSGSAIVETASVDKHFPIAVKIGTLQTKIIASGLYRFSGATAGVLDGKLQVASASAAVTTVKKGKEVTAIGNDFQQSPLESSVALDGLNSWSAVRSSQLAVANSMAYYRQTNGNNNALYYGSPYYSGMGYMGGYGGWVYSPFLNGFTFIPQYNYTSYYGYSFIPAPVFQRGPVVNGGRYSSAGTTPKPGQAAAPSVSNKPGTPAPSTGGMGTTRASAAPMPSAPRPAPASSSSTSRSAGPARSVRP